MITTNTGPSVIGVSSSWNTRLSEVIRSSPVAFPIIRRSKRDVTPAGRLWTVFSNSTCTAIGVASNGPGFSVVMVVVKF